MSNNTLSPALSPSAWLNEFCSSRRYNSNEALSLYQLHMTKAEYDELELVLNRSRSFQHNMALTKEWCAVFTLYCAEWFRREYSQDWSWEPIFERLKFSLSPAEISEAVPKGLEGYWRKSVSRYSQSNRNDYLGSLFREGGLPSNLLSRNDNSYQRTFSSIFDRYHMVREFGDSAVNQFISNKLGYLPESLQGEGSVELIRNMVEKLDSFVHTYNLDSQSDPVSYLEQNYPQWREVFPLPLDSETGTLFLSQLLSRATEEVRKVATKRRDLRCKHYIDFSNQCVVSDVLLPFRCSFDINRTQLTSSRIELAIFEGERHLASLGTGFAQFDGDQTQVSIRQSLASVVRRSTDSELFLVALQSGQQLGRIILAASTVDCEDSPLTLVATNDRWLVAGQATARTKAEQALVLVPRSVKPEVIRGDFSVNESLSFPNLVTFTLEGKVSLAFNNGDSFVVTTGAENYADELLSLKGDLVTWKTVPSLVFKGVPELNSLGVSEHLFGLCTYLNGAEIHSLAPSEVNGRQVFSVKNSENQVLLRKRIGVLPKDFQVELRPGETPRQGTVYISSQSPFLARVADSELEREISKPYKGTTAIELEASGMPPANFSLTIQASLLSDPITLLIPFPSTGMTAFNAEGKPLHNQLAVDDLLGCRVNLFSQQGCPTRYQITLTDLSNNFTERNPAGFAWDYRVVDKPLEISLYGLRDYVLELLSLSENLDSKVELAIKGNGETKRFIISYYSTTIEYDRDRQLVSLNSRILQDGSGVKALLMDVTKPEQVPLALSSRMSEGVETGEYELPSFLHDGGPWLVLPAENSEVSFRARFIPSDKRDSDLSDINTLQKAARAFNPRDEVTTIEHVIAQMANDWEHSGWSYLEQLWKRYQYLPMSTFEVWRHLVRNPRSLAVALFKFDMDASFIAKLEAQLPVLWEFIPLQCWLDAKRLFGATLQRLGIGEEMQTLLQANLIDKLAHEIPSLASTGAEYLKLERCNPPMPSVIMQPLIQDEWYQDLLRVHSEDNNWPNGSGGDSSWLCHALDVLPFDIKVNSYFQNGVVYAPIFAAAVACGRVPTPVLEQFENRVLFDYRKLKDFDREWFEPMFSFTISHLQNDA
ncbi:STY4851/ECs_5259 family protein [uncultured Ferrimonas sp.]|uniref:STY4851/ECs_5259 family protein n=1 Tax=uncultured Ferrimonas sp. TaxID=432640 RepID=UPI00260C2FB5|nr:STY4851/ECs_5259 family protein [uncultured Ferrimonas sp.]